MALQGILPFAHSLLREHLQNGDCAVDATAGNGHDTVLLAECVGADGMVYAFDVQQQALDNTLCRLKNSSLDGRTRLIAAGHERMADYVPQGIAAAVFNFGWLPGSDKSIATRAETSVAALQQAADLLKSGGLIAAAVYTGHAEGAEEAPFIDRWAENLPQERFKVLRYQFVNQKNRPPYLLAIYKI